MQKGKIHSVESMGLVDGPGIRTVLFFQGCKLRCRYCHNPDTWNMQGGKEMCVDEAMQMLRRYKPYYGTQGGITCSGGEPLLQIDFLTELFRACKQEGISTCLDTAGYGNGMYDTLLQYTDLILLDIKHYDATAYHNLTGGEISVPETFIRAVEKAGIPLWIRHVVVPHLTDSVAHIRKLGAYIKQIKNVEKIELLPYHTLGVEKYHVMGIPYTLEQIPSMTKATVAQLQLVIDNMNLA